GSQMVPDTVAPIAGNLAEGTDSLIRKSSADGMLMCAPSLGCYAMRDPNPWSDRVDRVRDWPGHPVARSRLPGSIHGQYRQSEDGDAGIADQCSGRFAGSGRLGGSL